MKSAAILLAALAIFAFAPSPASEAAPKKHFVLRGSDHYPTKRGGYSVKKSDTIETRKFWDPALGRTAQGQPFDNGFFFETPSGPYGGTTPYMH